MNSEHRTLCCHTNRSACQSNVCVCVRACVREYVFNHVNRFVGLTHTYGVWIFYLFSLIVVIFFCLCHSLSLALPFRPCKLTEEYNSKHIRRDSLRYILVIKIQMSAKYPVSMNDSATYACVCMCVCHRNEAMARLRKVQKSEFCRVYTAVYGAVTYLLFVDFNIQFTSFPFFPLSAFLSESIVKLLISRLNGLECTHWTFREFDTSQTQIAAKCNDKLSVLLNELNTAHCMLANAAAHCTLHTLQRRTLTHTRHHETLAVISTSGMVSWYQKQSKAKQNAIRTKTNSVTW